MCTNKSSNQATIGLARVVLLHHMPTHWPRPMEIPRRPQIEGRLQSAELSCLGSTEHSTRRTHSFFFPHLNFLLHCSVYHVVDFKNTQAAGPRSHCVLSPLSAPCCLARHPTVCHSSGTCSKKGLTANIPRIRCLSSTPARRDASVDITDIPPTPITHLSETETMMGEAVAKFASEVILPKAREMDEAEAMDPAVVEQLFEQGLMGIEIPEEYGGSGMNFTSAIIAIEELARVDPSVSVMCDVHNTLVNTAILKWGSEHIKKKYLPKLATNTVGSFCLSEPVSGSDAFALATKAVRTDTGYKISGSKMWITNSVEANFFIVFANLAPEKKYKGITAFIVEKGTKGFSIAKKEKKLGIKASSTCVINFDDVEIPKENLLGEEGHGYKYAIGLLNEGRIGIAAQMTGLALGAFENAAGYASFSFHHTS